MAIPTFQFYGFSMVGGLKDFSDLGRVSHPK